MLVPRRPMLNFAFIFLMPFSLTLTRRTRWTAQISLAAGVLLALGEAEVVRTVAQSMCCTDQGWLGVAFLLWAAFPLLLVLSVYFIAACLTLVFSRVQRSWTLKQKSNMRITRMKHAANVSFVSFVCMGVSLRYAINF
uniref:Uncharacterized protein n=1 Tax=Ixodes ricinus TaxID=34613 RepID=A0A6B0USQ8_IXORI